MSENEDFDTDDLDEQDEQGVDDHEAQAAQKGAEDDERDLSDAERAQAESLTVTARAEARQKLEDELAQFLAAGGKITQIPANTELENHSV